MTVAEPLGLGSQLKMELPGLRSIDLDVASVAESASFFRDLLGLKVEETGEGARVDVGGCDLNLTPSPDGEDLKLGAGVRCLVVGVPDLEYTVGEISTSSNTGAASIIDPPTTLKLGPCLVPDEPMETFEEKKVALVLSPSGWPVLLVEAPEPVPVKVSLQVTNLEETLAFYEKQGMILLKKRSLLPEIPALVAEVGVPLGDSAPRIELSYLYSTEKINVGSAFKSVTLAGPEAQSVNDPDGHPIKVVALE
eukprot:CAMPEP_0113943476 /NCGR_PEP_ID=MMETSP1339-20121228/24729_1 /TAXON_ID=94617 /ORGANISM="Fibrocapsa japonica" /LENGTH=250 /DNA_ID=CAMNT_0000948359 /DNA_START=198 /DNA_END=950 /DNA_ORIENTATION=+ /assembly_acc=CAM_ASM_000762